MSTIRKLLIAVILLLLLLYFAVDIKVIYVSEAEKVKRIHIENDSVRFCRFCPLKKSCEYYKSEINSKIAFSLRKATREEMKVSAAEGVL